MRYFQWRLVSNSVQATERVFSVGGLAAAAHYQLRITAHNNAGHAVALYNFTTHSLSGRKANILILRATSSNKSIIFFHRPFRQVPTDKSIVHSTQSAVGSPQSTLALFFDYPALCIVMPGNYEKIRPQQLLYYKISLRTASDRSCYSQGAVWLGYVKM